MLQSDMFVQNIKITVHPIDGYVLFLDSQVLVFGLPCLFLYSFLLCQAFNL